MNTNSINKNYKVHPAIFIIIAGVVSMISSLGAPLIPTIANYFQISHNLAGWSLTIALISGTASTPILAKLSRLGTYKNVILSTLIITMIGCFLSAYSPFFIIFLIGRALQGIGLGLIPSLMIAAQNSISDSKKTISLLSVTTGIGVGAGYPISGIMVSFIGIHGTFLYGGVIVLATILISTKLINIKKLNTSKFDIYGSILISLLLALLMLIIGSLKTDLNITYIFIYITGFIITLYLWIKSVEKNSDPIINIHLLVLKEAIITNCIAIFSGAILYILINASIFIIQQTSHPGLSNTPMMAGLTLTSLSLATLASRFIHFNNLTNKSKIRIGTTFLLFALLIFLIINSNIVICFLSMGLCGYGIGLIYGSLPHIIKDNIHSEHVEELYGLNQVSRSIGYAIGSVISINIISSLLLNASNEASFSTYSILIGIGLIFIIVLYSLISLIKV